MRSILNLQRLQFDANEIDGENSTISTCCESVENSTLSVRCSGEEPI